MRVQSLARVCGFVCANSSVWYLCVELLAQVCEQVFVAICCFTVEPGDVVGTLADPFPNELHDALQTGVLRAHQQQNCVF